MWRFQAVGIRSHHPAIHGVASAGVCLEPTRDKVRSQFLALQASGVDMDLILPTTAGATFYNVSQFALDSVGSKGCLEVLRESLPYPHPQP